MVQFGLRKLEALRSEVVVNSEQVVTRVGPVEIVLEGARQQPMNLKLKLILQISMKSADGSFQVHKLFIQVSDETARDDISTRRA